MFITINILYLCLTIVSACWAIQFYADGYGASIESQSVNERNKYSQYYDQMHMLQSGFTGTSTVANEKKTTDNISKNVGEKLTFKCNNEGEKTMNVTMCKPKDSLVVGVCSTVLKSFTLKMRVQKFDAGWNIKCSNLHDDKITHTKLHSIIEVKDIDDVIRTEPAIFPYEKKNYTFPCRTPQLNFSNIHWILFDRHNITYNAYSNYKSEYNLTLTLDERNSSSTLVCLYFNCTTVNSNVECNREILHTIQLEYKNHTDDAMYQHGDNPTTASVTSSSSSMWMWIGGTFGTVAISFFLVAIFIYFRKTPRPQENAYDTARVQYVDLDLGSASRKARVNKNEEPTYAEIQRSHT